MATQTDVVAKQYEKWIYPAPIMDLSAPPNKMGRDTGDPLDNQFQFWPQGGFNENKTLLVAGCGSNAAARMAYRFPKNRVVGIDLSAASLAHEEYLKQKHNLSNMSLYQGRLEEVETLIGETFDYIHVAGVLHHLPNPTVGMTALGNVLKPDGVMFVMLYGQYARNGVYMLQNLFREMGLDQSEESLALVKEGLSMVPEPHPIHQYRKGAYDLNYDSGIVDTFLHQMDRAYRVEDLLQLVEESNLTFQGWSENYMYYPNGIVKPQTNFFNAINKLEPVAMWKAMELFHSCLGKHCFYVCRSDRDASTYSMPLIDNPDFARYIPMARIPKLEASLPNVPISAPVERSPLPEGMLTPQQVRFLSHVDGKNSIQDCMDKSEWPQDATSRLHCQSYLESLRRLDYLCFRLP